MGTIRVSNKVFPQLRILKLLIMRVARLVSLKMEIQQVRDDCDRHIMEVKDLQAEASNQNDYKDTTNELESKCSSKNKEIQELQDQLVASERKLQVPEKHHYHFCCALKG